MKKKEYKKLTPRKKVKQEKDDITNYSRVPIVRPLIIQSSVLSDLAMEK